MKIDSFSIEGIHYSNEDSLSVHQLTPNKAVAVLADGMGGLTFGKEAADLIVSTITAFICEHVERLPIQNCWVKRWNMPMKLFVRRAWKLTAKWEQLLP